jgi:hypothetical protein
LLVRELASAGWWMLEDWERKDMVDLRGRRWMEEEE